MAHFAQIDDLGTVLNVCVVRDEDTANSNGEEDEQIGIVFLQSIFGAKTRWVQCSYSGRIRKRFAGIGMTYDALLDAFIPVQPDPSWTFNSTLVDWEAPKDSSV